jgi:hypothetical protein
MDTYLSSVTLPETVRPAGPAKDTICSQLNRLSKTLSKTKNKGLRRWLKANEDVTEFTDMFELIDHVKRLKNIIQRSHEKATKNDERAFIICCALLYRLTRMLR